jgi:glutamine---fructose-6-phosphate transaminase (isomerizing)
MSDMDAAGFLADLEVKPRVLRQLAEAIDDGALRWPIGRRRSRVLLTGMGSSWFAAQTVALRLRRAGISAVAELSSADRGWPAAADQLVVGISASGRSSETLDFVAGHPGVVALTNEPGSPITELAAHVVPMLAEPETGGVACRSFQHTLVALLALEEELTGSDLTLASRVRRSADATEALLTDRSWVEEVAGALDGPHGVYAIAPADRISSALQAALMVREGPRRAADGCETGDWSHVDVYLTKTLQYRAMLFPGSRHDVAAREWLRRRGATVVAVGAGEVGDAAQVRFPGDDDPIVAMLTEVIVAELLAWRWWIGAH